MPQSYVSSYRPARIAGGDLARLLVFGWLILSVLLVLPAALYDGMWEPAVRTALFSGALIGLMLERLREPVVAALCLVAAGVVYW